MSPETLAGSKTVFRLIPVIFATGNDDDLPGLIAACRNEEVLFGDKAYRPGENITIRGKVLAFACRSIEFWNEDGTRVDFQPFPYGGPGTAKFLHQIVVCKPGRKVWIDCCRAIFNFEALS